MCVYSNLLFMIRYVNQRHRLKANSLNSELYILFLYDLKFYFIRVICVNVVNNIITATIKYDNIIIILIRCKKCC